MTVLNPQQRQAAGFFSGICSVIAIPGSGKTLTMIERICRLIKHHRVAPENILGLTFTRNAAQNMRDRLALVLQEVASRVTLSTMHSFCYGLLKNEGRYFEVLQGKEQLRLLKKLIHRLQLKDISPGSALTEIGLAKNNLISIEEFRDLYQGDNFMLQIAEVYQAYDEEKSQRLLLDFDDMLWETYRLLDQDEEVRTKYQNLFRHVLVDEYQDHNPAQIGILKLLIDVSQGSSFWVCGDEMQTIFSFNGSSISNILNFHQIFPGSQQLILDVNYRSTPQILRACQNLMQHNVRKIDKQLTPLREPGEEVMVLEADSEEDEAWLIVNEVCHLVGAGQYAYQDMALLYRANFQSRVLEEVLAKNKIPYRIENGLNFYQRYEIRMLLDYIWLIQTPDSDRGDEALRTILNVPNRYIGKSFLQELELYSAKTGRHLYPTLKAMPLTIPYLKRNVRELVNFLEPLMAQAEELEPSELIYLLRETLDYDRYITDDELPSPDDIKIANLNQLQVAATKFGSLASFLHFTEDFQDATGHDQEGISLMTIHKAKGLEFPVVFVTGLVEGLLPNKYGELEEERRVAFVAMSRAMSRLYLTFYRTYLGNQAQPSIFLEEIKSEEDHKLNPLP